MDNSKTKMLTSTSSTPVQRYYRSVRYKINTSSLGEVNNSNLVQSRARSTVKKPLSRTNKSWKEHCTVNRSGVGLRGDSNPEKKEDKMEVEVRRPYLDTWYKLLHFKKDEGQDGKSTILNINSINNTKNTISNVGVVEQKQQSKGVRVYLPQITQNNDSMFTMLDPLPLSYTHIQEGIEDLKKRLPQPKEEMRVIKADLKGIELKVKKQLSQIEHISMKGFAKLRKMLRGDQTDYQENMLKFKRMCGQLKEKDAILREELEETKPRVEVLQDQIFNSRPFQLECNWKEYGYQFSSKYF